MTRASRRARQFRTVILIVGLLYTVSALLWAVLPYLNDVLFDGGSAVVGLFGTPLTFSDNGYAASLALFFGALLLAQWAFLRPGKLLAARLTAGGRPLKSSVLAAAAMAMLLSVGLIALLLELPNWWETVLWEPEQWAPEVLTESTAGELTLLITIRALPMLVLWAFWAWIFFAYWRQGDRYTQLGRMIRGLVAGSLVEALVAVPVHVWIMRQRECYCARGTYTTLVFAGTVLLWAFGPGIILLYVREKYRRAKVLPLCPNCGYDLRGSPAMCPECGTRRMSDGE